MFFDCSITNKPFIVYLVFEDKNGCSTVFQRTGCLVSYIVDHTSPGLGCFPIDSIGLFLSQQVEQVIACTLLTIYSAMFCPGEDEITNLKVWVTSRMATELKLWTAFKNRSTSHQRWHSML